MYAIVEIAGFQYRVQQGEELKVPHTAGEPGSNLKLERVLLLSDNGKTQIGTPTVKGVTVDATVVRHGRGRKVIVYKFRRRKHYRRTQGHRQDYSVLRINSIKQVAEKPAATKATPKPKTAAQKKTPAAKKPATGTKAAAKPAPKTGKATKTTSKPPAKGKAASTTKPKAKPAEKTTAAKPKTAPKSGEKKTGAATGSSSRATPAKSAAKPKDASKTAGTKKSTSGSRTGKPAKK